MIAAGVDVGSTATKAIRIAPNGGVEDFCMNDKCAAGTGRFLEAAASTMAMSLDEIGPLSLQHRQSIKITNVCTVFVESEILAHLARGRSPADILRGVHLAIAGRSVALMRRVGLDPEIIRLLDLHFEKEETILFPMARQMLTPESLEHVARSMETIGKS